MNHTSTKERLFGFTKLSALAGALLFSYACSSSSETTMAPFTAPEVAPVEDATVPTPDPRVGLEEGLYDA